MKKVLFFLHNMADGGAQKVLVNLVNNMDRSKFDISVTALFGDGVNEQFLAPDIHFRTVFPRAVPGNSKLMKLLTPAQLHRLCVKEHYDIEISYLEGSVARVISGCEDQSTRLVCWIHSTMESIHDAAKPFRSIQEVQLCYKKFHRIICVSEDVKQVFAKLFPNTIIPLVLYNTLETSKIAQEAGESLLEKLIQPTEINLISVGSMKRVKGFDRLLRIHARLQREGYPVHTYLLGKGPDLEILKRQVDGCRCGRTVTFLGYDINPYKYVSKADVFICSSHSEGFSTAATEALIVGTPVCTVEVSGMKEMLGEHNEWGIVTENSEEALYQGIKDLLDHPDKLAHYKEKAIERGKTFSTENTVRAVERMLLEL